MLGHRCPVPFGRRRCADAAMLVKLAVAQGSRTPRRQGRWGAAGVQAGLKRSGKPDLARAWRQDAVALWRSGPPLDAEQTVRVVDALRRAETWEDAEATAAELAALSPSEAVAQVVALERRLIAGLDAGRHSVASALPPPAHRPHVTHRRRDPAPGSGLIAWLRRLFGRTS